MRAFVLTAGLAAAACPEARAQQVHAYAAIASDYVDRGVALGGGGAPLLQLGIESAWDSGFVAGAFGTTLDRAWTRDRVSSRAELDAYAGYDFACGGGCRARAVATRYAFPGRREADWTEWSLAIAPHPRFGASLSHAGHVYALPFAGTTVEAWYEHPLGAELALGVAAGRIRTRVFDYGYGRIGATWRRGAVAVDVSYHAADPEYRDNGFIDDLRHIVATVTWSR